MTSSGSVAATPAAADVRCRLRRRSLAALLGAAALAAVTLPTAAHAAAPGAVASYAFDEGTGNTSADTTGNGRTAALRSTSWTSGRFGRALSFNGTTSLAQVADSAALDLSGAMTLEAWVRPDTTSGTATVLAKPRNRGGVSYGLELDGGKPAGFAYAGSSSRRAVAGEAVQPGTWRFLAVTYDGSSLRTYLDGEQVAAVPASGTLRRSSNPLEIGGSSVRDEGFDGAIDNVRVYSRALSGAELAADRQADAADDATAPTPEPTPTPTPTPDADADADADALSDPAHRAREREELHARPLVVRVPRRRVRRREVGRVARAGERERDAVDAGAGVREQAGDGIDHGHRAERDDPQRQARHDRRLVRHPRLRVAERHRRAARRGRRDRHERAARDEGDRVRRVHRAARVLPQRLGLRALRVRGRDRGLALRQRARCERRRMARQHRVLRWDGALRRVPVGRRERHPHPPQHDPRAVLADLRDPDEHEHVRDPERHDQRQPPGGGRLRAVLQRRPDVPGETVSGNRFARTWFPRSGYWGPTTGCEDADVFSGNVWDDTGAAL